MRDCKETSGLLRGLAVSLQVIDSDYAQLCEDAADVIEELIFERDKYKSFFDRIANLPDCNTCLKKRECEFVPRAGEHTRINCAFYVPDPREVKNE